MDIRQGLPVSPGIAIGEVFLLEAEGVRIPEHFIAPEHAQAQMERLKKALDEAARELRALADDVRAKSGAKIAEIFVAHAGMLEDESFRKELIERVSQKYYTAEFAVARTMRHWRKVFQEDAFLAMRVADLDDLERRLLRFLLGQKREELSTLQQEVIIVAHDLSPSQIATVDTEHVKAFATDAGGPTSHAAIIASAMGLPAVVGLGSITNDVSGGDVIIVDGSHGLVIIEPDSETIERYRARRSEVMESGKVLLRKFKDLPTETQDGRHVSLFANIESPKDIPRVLEYGAEGIGLYRTEFLFLGRKTPPTERDHLEAYMEAVRQLGDRPIIIRTLDLGADKFALDTPVVKEGNPFLGLRSLRYCLSHPDLLNVQLRAILKASSFGNVKVMFPLISSLDELLKARRVLSEIQEDFKRIGIQYDPDLEVGAMIEVPSAAVCADSLAQHSDFFSIGTNDLIQYSLAVDRANEHVAHLYRAEHPAVLRLIRMTTDAARKAAIPVGLCGEMASVITYTALLVGLGLDSLSVAPPQVLPEIKKAIRSLKFTDAQKLASDVLQADSPAAVMKRLEQVNKRLLSDIVA